MSCRFIIWKTTGSLTGHDCTGRRSRRFTVSCPMRGGSRNKSTFPVAEHLHPGLKELALRIWRHCFIALCRPVHPIGIRVLTGAEQGGIDLHKGLEILDAEHRLLLSAFL